MRNVMFALAIVALTAATASAQSSGPANAFFGGLGAYPMGGSYQQLLPPQTARQKAAINAPKVIPQVNGHASGCGSLCQAKCQASWRALGFGSVNACVARWNRLNAEGTAATCETAIKANGLRPVRGC